MTFQHDGAPIFFNRLAYLNENYINKWIEHGHKNQQISVHQTITCGDILKAW